MSENYYINKQLPLALFFFVLSFSVRAQEGVKLAFFKAGVIEYRYTDTMGVKMPKQSIIGLMVAIKEPNCSDLGVNLQGKIVLLLATKCSDFQLAKAAERAGAAAVIIARSSNSDLASKGANTPEKIQIPVSLIDAGTAIYYQSLLPRPMLVCLSATAYEGKIVDNETPKVKNLTIDDVTRAMIVNPENAIATTDNSPTELLNTPTRTIERPETLLAAVANTEQDNASTIVSEQSNVNANASFASNDVRANMDVLTQNKSVVLPPESVATKPISAPILAASPETVTKAIDNEYLREAIEIYPKRVSEIATFTYSLEKCVPLKIELRNDKNVSVQTWQVPNARVGMLEIELTNHPSGNYSILVSDGLAVAETKFIVEH